MSGGLLILVIALDGSYGGAMPMSPLMPMNPMGGMGMMRGPHGSYGVARAVAPIPGAPEVRVQAGNFFFTPAEVHLPRNAAVNLTLVNAAGTGVVHDFTVPSLGIRVAAEPGQTSTVGLRDLPQGRYAAYCSIPGHADAGMRATLVVE